jgi:hypothetical protein
MHARPKLLVDGREIVVIDDFMSGERLANLATFFDFAPAQRVEGDRTGEGASRLWVIPIRRDVAEQQPYYRDIVKVIAEQFPRESFALQRAYCNAISYGDMLYPHRDNRDTSSRDLTALLFVADTWEKDWGGETIFFDDAGDSLFAVWPRPGRLVLFRSTIEHRAGTPSRICPRTRLTLALKLTSVSAAS